MHQVSNEEYLRDLEKYHKWEELLAVTQKLIARNDDSLEQAHYYRGVALHELRRLEEALEEFNLSLKANPANPLALNSRGLVLRDLGRAEEAIASFELAFKKDPYMTSASINKALTLQALGRPEEALAIFEGILKKSPGLVTVLIFKAECLIELKRSREALAVYDKAIELEPNAPDLLNNKGNILALEGRANEALDCYNKALYLNPEFGDTYLSIGFLQQEQGKYREAIGYYDQAIKYDVEGPFPFIDKGICLFELKSPDLAEKELDLAVNNYPSSPFALYNRAIFSAIKGRMSESLILLRKAVKLIEPLRLSDQRIEQVVADTEAQFAKVNNALASSEHAGQLEVDYGRLAGDLLVRRPLYADIETNLKELRTRVAGLEADATRSAGLLADLRALETTKPELHEYLSTFATLYNEFLAQLPLSAALKRQRSFIGPSKALVRSDVLRLFYIAGGESAADFLNKSLSEGPSTKYTQLLTTAAALVGLQRKEVDLAAVQLAVDEAVVRQLLKSDDKTAQIKAFDFKKPSFHQQIIQNAIRSNPQIKPEISSASKAIAVKDFILMNAYLEDHKSQLLAAAEPFEKLFERVFTQNLHEDERVMPFVPPQPDLRPSLDYKDLFQVKVALENRQGAKSTHQIFLQAFLCRDLPPGEPNSPQVRWTSLYKSAPAYFTPAISYQFIINDKQLPQEWINRAALKVEIVKVKSSALQVTKGQGIYFLKDLLNIGSQKFNFIQQNGFSKKNITVTVEASALMPSTLASRFY